MQLNVLIDLDDTLLLFNGDFFAEYFNLLHAKLPGVSIDVFSQAMRNAVTKEILKDSAEKTLEEAFDETFYTQIGIAKESLIKDLRAFYRTEYSTLKRFAVNNSPAISLVDSLFRQGHTVAIATNPLFPPIATCQRMDWAGLDPKKYPFACISTFDFFHFTKPNPAYFAEMLAYLGWNMKPTVMIGDHYQNDVCGPELFGIPGFHISTESKKRENPHVLSSSGGLAEVEPWIQDVIRQKLQFEIKFPDGYMAVLKSTPAAFDTFMRFIDPAVHAEQPKDTEWSFSEILGHLLMVDDEYNIPALASALGRNGYSPAESLEEATKTKRDFRKANVANLMMEYFGTRQRLIHLVQEVPSEKWDLEVSHKILGRLTIKNLIIKIAEHDQNHVRQVSKLMADLNQTRFFEYRNCINCSGSAY